MQGARIVVWDPTGEYWEGSVVDGARARMLEARRVATLPCEPDLFRRGAVAGYMRRSWGSGWPLDAGFPRLCCPLILWAAPHHRKVAWCARLLPDPARAAEAKDGVVAGLSGFLRLVPDSGQPHVNQASFKPEGGAVDAQSLGKLDELGGWVVGGGGILSPASEGHFAFTLYGAIPGVRVAWAAVSCVQEGWRP